MLVVPPPLAALGRHHFKVLTMPEPRVTSSTRLWSTEVAMADAADVADAAQQGVVALESRAPYPEAYTFSNGRKFRDGKGPYE